MLSLYSTFSTITMATLATAILNGHDASVKDSSPIAYLSWIDINSRTELSCTAVLIGKNRALTAGSGCCECCHKSDTKLRYGGNSRAQLNFTIPLKPATSFKIHPQSNFYSYDYCVLKLPTDIKPENGVSFAKLSRKRPADNSILNYFGWGPIAATNRGYEPRPAKLQTGKVQVISDKICEEKYKDIHNITETNMCVKTSPADAPPVASCAGDRGAPLMDKAGKVVYAIADSSSYECTRDARPDLFAPVAPVVDWIEAQ